MKRSLLFVAALLMAAYQMSAQSIEVNKRWGKVSKEEVEMTEYQLDTAATAVILYEKKHVTIDLTATGDIVQSIDVHKRIKILKEDGKLESGDVSLDEAMELFEKGVKLIYGCAPQQDITGLPVIYLT